MRRLVGAALLDQLDREVQVDVVPGRQRHRVARVEPGADQLLGAPVLDALDLRLGDDMYFRRSHVPGIRCEAARGSPPEGGSQPIRRASRSACALEIRPSSRRVTGAVRPEQHVAGDLHRPLPELAAAAEVGQRVRRALEPEAGLAVDADGLDDAPSRRPTSSAARSPARVLREQHRRVADAQDHRGEHAVEQVHAAACLERRQQQPEADAPLRLGERKRSPSPPACERSCAAGSVSTRSTVAPLEVEEAQDRRARLRHGERRRPARRLPPRARAHRHGNGLPAARARPRRARAPAGTPAPGRAAAGAAPASSRLGLQALAQAREGAREARLDRPAAERRARPRSPPRRARAGSGRRSRRGGRPGAVRRQRAAALGPRARGAPPRGTGPRPPGGSRRPPAATSRSRRPAERRRLRASLATIRSSHGLSAAPRRKRPSARWALTNPSCAASSASAALPAST